MKTGDIKGNKPGSTRLGVFHSRERRSIREIGRNDDIEGSKPGSLVAGIRVPTGAVQRVCNPLQPDYQMPGRLEENDPYGTGSSMLQIGRPKTAIPRVPIAQVAKAES